jgi:hypothetical protein
MNIRGNLGELYRGNAILIEMIDLITLHVPYHQQKPTDVFKDKRYVM